MVTICLFEAKEQIFVGHAMIVLISYVGMKPILIYSALPVETKKWEFGMQKLKRVLPQ